MVVLGAFLARFGFPSLPTSSDTPESAAQREVVSASDDSLADAQRDRDGDGLLDWEETLWRTNADNPDTDGDGTPDGEEVAAGRDPTRPGPNDTYPTEPIAKNATSSAATTSPQTLTAAVAQRLLLRYLELKARGSDPRIVLQAQNELLSLVPLEKENPFADLPYLKEEDLTILEDTSSASVRAYGNALAQAVLQPTPTSTPPEILYRFARTQNPALLRELEGYVTALDAAINELQRIAVPKPFVLHHLALANLLIDQRAFLQAVAHLSEDPLTAAIAVRSYLENAPLVVKTFARIADALETYGVFYTSSEPGSFFGKARAAYAKIQQQQGK